MTVDTDKDGAVTELTADVGALLTVADDGKSMGADEAALLLYMVKGSCYWLKRKH